MREVLGNRMPDYTADEWALVKGSSDFYGMNTYTTNLCSTYTCVLEAGRKLILALDSRGWR